MTAQLLPCADFLGVTDACKYLFMVHPGHSDAKIPQMADKKVVAEGNELLFNGNIALGEGCFGLRKANGGGREGKLSFAEASRGLAPGNGGV